jgi:hypothetical protein
MSIEYSDEVGFNSVDGWELGAEADLREQVKLLLSIGFGFSS